MTRLIILTLKLLKLIVGLVIIYFVVEYVARGMGYMNSVTVSAGQLHGYRPVLDTIRVVLAVVWVFLVGSGRV